MENKLEIRKEPTGNEMIVFLSGRLDANWAGYLDDYLNDLVREGSHRILLDMTGVPYLSSAGIRILVNQYKKIKKIGGFFALTALSEAVAEILNMVGMKAMLTETVAEKIEPPKEVIQKVELNNYRFINEQITDQSFTVSVTGNPDLVIGAGYTSAHHQKIKGAFQKYGLGIGAFGDDFEDCKQRFGEFIAFGDVMVYKPSDGSKIPDYAIRTGSLQPEINVLYSLWAEGNFGNRITFDPIGGISSLGMGDLLNGLSKTTGLSQFVFLAIAESDGLIGVTICKSPVDHQPLLELPAIRDHVNFTTEPAFPRMLTVTLGFFLQHPPETIKPFLRQESAGSSNYVHIHTAIFPFQSLPKAATSPEQLVDHLFDSSIVQEVMHLLKDSREITGLGESTFKQGVAWVGKINKPQ